MTETREERREYYRVDDELMFSYRILEQGETADNLISDEQESRAINTLQQCSQISHEIRTSLGSIEAHTPELGRVLRGLDRKINLLTQLVVYQEAGEDQPPRQVNIGLGGVAFGSDEPLAAGTLLLIRVLMGAEPRNLRLKAQVLESTADNMGDFPYRVSCEFIELDEGDAQVISKHVVMRQQEMLRQKKRQQE